MKKEVVREMARAGYPVVTIENGAHGEIVYPYIKYFGVQYASPEERAAGFPVERLVVEVASRCGFSSTVVLPRQLRLPTDDEAIGAVPPDWTLSQVDDMLDELKRLREMEDETTKGE